MSQAEQAIYKEQSLDGLRETHTGPKTQQGMHRRSDEQQKQSGPWIASEELARIVNQSLDRAEQFLADERQKSERAASKQAGRAAKRDRLQRPFKNAGKAVKKLGTCLGPACTKPKAE